MCRVKWREEELVPAEAHGDGAGGDFGESSEEDDGGSNVSAGETSGESEWNGETVGDSDYDVADDFSGGEVLLFVTVE